MNGIDVSSWQGNINWEKVSNTDVGFAMIRATYGTSGKDKQFVQNMNNITKTNIYPGAYHYLYATSVSEAKQEAQNFLNAIKSYKFLYPVALDIEDSSISSLGRNTATQIALTFCDIVENSGYYVNIYSNLNWLQNYLNMNELSKFDIWLAQWSSSPTYTGNFGMWQHSSTGSVSGINGNVDLNISYLDYPTIITSKGLNNTSSSQLPSPPDTDTKPPTSTFEYVVVTGDTLWDIAEKFLGSGARYEEIKTLNGLTGDTIYAGQVLNVPSGTSGSKSYTVVSGDTLWDIAERFLGSGSRYTELKTLNGLTSDTIYPGQVLLI